MYNYSKEKLNELKSELEKKHEEYKARGLALDMSRGKPGPDQLDLTNEMLIHCLDGDHLSEDGFDCRNYGILDGIPEAKRLFLKMLGVEMSEIIIGGNSSLKLMYDAVVRAMIQGVYGGKRPWLTGGAIKFLCPSPGYDRHFAICEKLGIEMIIVDMKADGPDMDAVEKLVSEDEAIKGIWCVPLYSNPDGITYSNDVVKRFANLNPKADDFRIFWDNAYLVHYIYEEVDSLLNILDECKKAGKEDMVYIFSSTSKISFPGGGLGIMAGSANNMKLTREQMAIETIGHDKLNQLRHAKFFKDYDGIMEHMAKHRDILRPKFKMVLDTLDSELSGLGIGSWNKPSGGYFVSYNGIPNTAKRMVALLKDAGVVMTPAGATFPYGKDPLDRNVRIAPTFPSVEELKSAMEIFCNSAKLAAAESLLAQ
ncbi:MAG: aminotransferase class I/II-fold pyridoxal phosphate-dependent enzyme [Oscillospiraceae bacterium]|nr:aminotransferase class I/II-fold pyridoxal phosphate-dependent enzyme [Oscillospiraceae bacterium]